MRAAQRLRDLLDGPEVALDEHDRAVVEIVLARQATMDQVASDRMGLLKRVLALLAGWALVFWGLAMAGGGHALWQAFGARTIYVGLLEALALVIIGDALLIGLLVAKSGERSKVIIGFFCVMGLLVSLGAFGAIRHAWRIGM